MTTPTRGADPRRLRREVMAVDDERLRQIVRLVDAMPVRGDADSLIAPMRARLALLRPSRPLSLTRLLFLPVDPLVVEPRHWRPGDLGIPRSVLPPLAGVVGAGLGAMGPRLAAQLAGHVVEDAGLVAQAGAELWPAAAAVLRTCPMPPGWAEATGLRPAAFEALTRPLAAVLAQAPALWRIAAPPDEATDLALAQRLLGAVVPDGADALALLLALLLARFPDPAPVLRLADDVARQASPEARGAPERALDFLLASLDIDDPAGDEMALGTDAIRRAAVLVQGLQTERPARLAQLDRVRRRLGAMCRDRFANAAGALGAAPGGAMPDPAEAIHVSDAAVAALEADAIELRRLEIVGRRLGPAAGYDTALRRAAERLVAAPGLSHADRLRLAEILLGPDAALQLLGHAGPPPATN